MTWFTEDPTWLIVIGSIIEIGLLVALLRSGRGALLAALVAVPLLVFGLVIIERVIVTPREEVENSIAQITAALRKNDAQGVLSWFDPADQKNRGRAERAMGLVTILDANATDLDITVNQAANPPEATAKFLGTVKFKDLTGQMPHNFYLARFLVHFRKHGDRWLVYDYSIVDRDGNSPDNY